VQPRRPALELQHRAPLLIERINLFFGRLVVTRLVLVQGPLPLDSPPSRAGLHSLAVGRTDLDDARLSGIADSQLREALARLGRAVAETRVETRCAGAAKRLAYNIFGEETFIGDLDRCSRGSWASSLSAQNPQRHCRISWSPKRRQSFRSPRTTVFLANPAAPITIVEYASLGCPHCAHFTNDVLPELKKAWIDTGKSQVSARDFRSTNRPCAPQ